MANRWVEVLGPVYLESGLRQRGIEDVTRLIGLHTSDGDTIYPHAQFDILPDGTTRPREKVIELWNNLIVPAINEGIVDEYTATGLLLQGTEEKPSWAEKITIGEVSAEIVEKRIKETIGRFRQ